MLPLILPTKFPTKYPAVTILPMALIIPCDSTFPWVLIVPDVDMLPPVMLPDADTLAAVNAPEYVGK